MRNITPIARRRNKEEQQFYFLIGIAVSGEKQPAEGTETDSSAASAAAQPYLEHEREQQFSSARKWFHVARRPNVAARSYVSQ